MCPILNVDVLKKIFGADVVSGGEGKLIRQKCNQKCIDLYNKRIKVKTEGSGSEKELTECPSQEEKDVL